MNDLLGIGNVVNPAVFRELTIQAGVVLITVMLWRSWCHSSCPKIFAAG
ncbi:MAG: hypothetical protein ACLUB5_00905 [Bifidobacterium dentium]